MKRIFVIIIVLIGVVACHQQESSYILIDIGNAVNDKGSDKMMLNDIGQIVRLIPTETNDTTLLAHMSIAGVTKQHVVVYDKYVVYFINKDNGKVSYRLNKQGRGAEEYGMIFSVTVNEADSIIYLFDPVMRNLNIYTFDGQFVNAIKNDSIGGHVKLNDGNFAVCFSPYSKTEHRLGIYDQSWNLLRESINRSIDQKFAMYFFDIINKFNGEFYYKAAFIDTIYHISSKEENPYIVISQGKYKIPTEVIASLEKINKEGHNYIQQEYGVLASKYFFLTYNYNRMLYHDIWDIENSSLIYRSKYGREGGWEGIPVSIGGVQINVWPSYVDGDNIYCVIQGEDAIKLIPSLPLDANPIILEFKMKG